MPLWTVSAPPVLPASLTMPIDQQSMNAAFAGALLDPGLPLPRVLNGNAPKRFAVYRNNVTVGLVRALESNFPAVQRLLGETYFSGLAREFAQTRPPKTPLMFLYGAEFPAFLEAQTDLREYPFLADVAKLEQQWRVSYHAEDAICLSPEVLSKYSDDELPRLRFKPHPATSLLASRFAVQTIFTTNRSDATVGQIDPARPEWVLVTRPLAHVLTRSVSHAEFVFLQSLCQGEELQDAAAQAFERNDTFDLSACIAIMLAAGAFQRIAD